MNSLNLKPLNYQNSFIKNFWAKVKKERKQDKFDKPKFHIQVSFKTGIKLRR